MNKGHYLDSAAITQGARMNGAIPSLSLVDILHQIVGVRGSKAWELVFGANATRVFQSVIESLIGCNRKKWRQGIIRVEPRLHPVFLETIEGIYRMSGLRPRQFGVLDAGGTSHHLRRHLSSGVLILPATCWRTGKVLYTPEQIRCLRAKFSDVVLIIDAVQCLGNIPQSLFRRLLYESGADIVLGNTQKWLGVSRPLGIAWVRTEFLRKRPDMRKWLELNDYLGSSAGIRHLLKSFPDTYDARVANEIAIELHRQFQNQARINQHYRVLEKNTLFLRDAFGRLKDCFLLNPANNLMDVTAITSIGGNSLRLCKVSRALQKAGFQHTLLKGNEGKNTRKGFILRISAPLQEMRPKERMLLSKVLAPFQTSK